MASVAITITGITDLRGLQETSGNSTDQLRNIDNIVWGILTGSLPATSLAVCTGSANAARATGTLTLSSATGTVGGTIGGTAVTVTWATSDTATAAAIATAINANTTVNKFVSATSAAGVVTITAHAFGETGNQITLVASGTGVTASGAKLGTGGGTTAGAGPNATPVVFSVG